MYSLFLKAEQLLKFSIDRLLNRMIIHILWAHTKKTEKGNTLTQDRKKKGKITKQRGKESLRKLENKNHPKSTLANTTWAKVCLFWFDSSCSRLPFSLVHFVVVVVEFCVVSTFHFGHPIVSRTDTIFHDTIFFAVWLYK